MICKNCIHHEICCNEGRDDEALTSCADFFEVVKCKDCKHSIKKNYDGDISYEYLCVLKSIVTHLEEHEANYFCAAGERKETDE